MPDESATAFQYSTIGALLEGHFDGGIPIRELRAAGDFGIGTFDGLDGELIALDGRFLQVRDDGSVHAVPDSATSPFAVVTFFRNAPPFPLDGQLDLPALVVRLDRERIDENLPYAVRVDGRFSAVVTRSLPRQRKPYPRLVEVTARQPTFRFGTVEGTLVGFRFPRYMSGTNVAGYHFHFVTNDRAGGGHVLSLALESGTGAVRELRGVDLRLPGGDAFRRLRLGEDLAHEVEAAER